MNTVFKNTFGHSGEEQCEYLEWSTARNFLMYTSQLMLRGKWHTGGTSEQARLLEMYRLCTVDPELLAHKTTYVQAYLIT